MGRLGQAKSQVLQLSSEQMVRIFLEYPARWPAGSQVRKRYTGGSSGIQVGQLERTWYSNPQEERGRAERREASGSPHASFNSGISAETGREVQQVSLKVSLSITSNSTPGPPNSSHLKK